MVSNLPVTVRSDLCAIVVGPVVVVSRRDDLAALDHHCSQGKAHRALGRGFRTLREVELGLVHGGLYVSRVD